MKCDYTKAYEDFILPYFIKKLNNNHMKYKIGDKVRIKLTGEIDTITSIESSGEYNLKKLQVFGSFAESRLEPATKTLDDLEVGDVLLTRDLLEKTVLAVCGKDYALSDTSFENMVDDWYTVQEMKNYNFTLKQDPIVETVEELTMEEVCKELGRTIKIKK